MHRRHVSASLARLGLRYTDVSSATGMLQRDVAAVRAAMLLDLVTPMPSAVPLSSASSAAAAVGHEPTSSIAAAPVQDADKLCNGDSKSPARPASCCGGGGSPAPPAGAATANCDLQRRIAEAREYIAALTKQKAELTRKLEEQFSLDQAASEATVPSAEAIAEALVSELDDASSNLRIAMAALSDFESQEAAARAPTLRAEIESIQAIIGGQRQTVADAQAAVASFQKEKLTAVPDEIRQKFAQLNSLRREVVAAQTALTASEARLAELESELALMSPAPSASRNQADSPAPRRASCNVGSGFDTLTSMGQQQHTPLRDSAGSRASPAAADAPVSDAHSDNRGAIRSRSRSRSRRLAMRTIFRFTMPDCLQCTKA